MSAHYRAKISMSDTEILFEINDDLLDLDADKFAKQAVHDWLLSHGDIVDDKLIKIKKNDVLINYLNEESGDRCEDDPTQ